MKTRAGLVSSPMARRWNEQAVEWVRRWNLRSVPRLSLEWKGRSERSGNFRRDEDHRRADRRRNPVVLRDGSFPINTSSEVGIFVDRSPRHLLKNRGVGGKPSVSGDFSRSLRTFDAYVYVRERVRVLRKRFFSQRGQRLCIVCVLVVRLFVHLFVSEWT
jgi:hypothetical protein